MNTEQTTNAETVSSTDWMGELERRADEAKRLAETYYCQQDYESSMKLDIRARALREALQLARSSPIEKLTDCREETSR